jgi:phosphatidylserine/phosphatidylglycerophosphate/cardiolipin synthase-like enzyme
VVIDGTEVIIGSHNWSAGSYFQFDDASVLVTSLNLAAEMSQRFETLWQMASTVHEQPS